MSVAEMTNVRPPLFRYWMRPMEDRAATEAQGYLVQKDEPWVTVQQLGSKDEAEFPAEQWLAQMRQETRISERRMPRRFVEMFEEGYRRFKAGEAMEVNGTSIKLATFLSQSEIGNLQRIGVQAIEDGAAMNDDTIRRYGMGGATIRAKCQAWLKTRDADKAAVALNAANEKVTALEQQIEIMKANQAEMQAQLQLLNAATRKMA